MTPKELHEKLEASQAGGYIIDIAAECMNNLPLILRALSALSGLESVKGADEWQPIETAPRDVNTEFLAFGHYWYPDDKAPTTYQRIAWYSGDENYPWEDDEGRHPPGFYSHWQPMRNPPALSQLDQLEVAG